MHFNYSDAIGSIGVSILLLAFILNLLNKADKEGLVYMIMNIVGGSLACIASYLIRYIPFIILEALWTLVSVVALYKHFKKITYK